MDEIKIVALSGSLRKGSYLRQVVRSLQQIAPDGVEISDFPLHEIPLYNQDVENEVGFPAPVQKLRDAIAEADGVIFATPEYNGGISGVLKNAIDWASRQGLLAKRPAAPITGTPGALGGTKAQEQLRSVLNHLGMYVMPRPAIAIPQIHEKFENNTIVDEQTRNFIREWLEEFQRWIIQMNK